MTKLDLLEDHYKLKGSEMISYFEVMRKIIHEKSGKRDFSKVNEYTDEEFEIVSPLTKLQFYDLLHYCEPGEYNGNIRYIFEKYLITFLFKLRLGVSDDV